MNVTYKKYILIPYTQYLKEIGPVKRHNSSFLSNENGDPENNTNAEYGHQVDTTIEQPTTSSVDADSQAPLTQNSDPVSNTKSCVLNKSHTQETNLKHEPIAQKREDELTIKETMPPQQSINTVNDPTHPNVISHDNDQHDNRADNSIQPHQDLISKENLEQLQAKSPQSSVPKEQTPTSEPNTSAEDMDQITGGDISENSPKKKIKPSKDRTKPTTSPAKDSQIFRRSKRPHSTKKDNTYVYWLTG